MSGTLVATSTLPARSLDVPLERSETNLRGFAMLVIPLALLLVVFRVYRLEQLAFFTLACLVFGGFVVSYWLPLRFKQTFFILLSLAGAYLLLAPMIASLLIATGMALFGIVRSGWSFVGK